MSRLEVVSQDLSLEEYRELAEFRHQIRCFLSVTEDNAKQVGLEPQTYLLLLAMQGLPEGTRPTITELARRMCLPRDAVSNLVDEAASRSEVSRSSAEGNEEWVKLTRTGRDLLRRMALANRDELERTGPELVRALQSVLKQRRRHRGVGVA
jgi:DNA-binding MarR family transcriptional regulator